MTIITQYFEVNFFISIKDVISSIDLWRQVGIWTGNVAAYQNHKFKKYFSKIQEKKSRILEKYLQKFSRIENPKKSRILEISRSRNLERETLGITAHIYLKKWTSVLRPQQMLKHVTLGFRLSLMSV